MKYIVIWGLVLCSFGANAATVYTSETTIDEFWTWAESEAGVDGDILIKMTTGIAECPTGVYLKNSTVAQNLVSTALAAYMAKKQVVFQVWNGSSRFWSGSSTPYCQIRAIRLPK